MSSDPVISVRRLTKEYRLYRRPEDRLKQSFLGGRRRLYSRVAAVSDVSFDVHRGETFGIVGQNGSGKSTLLQMLCGTTYPTSGEVTVRGRVAGLLELGAGFNPEFTGRENIWVTATIQGLDERRIRDRISSIEAFADIGRFIDEPVKSYSSGMFARLAFAVSIHVDADILVVDEALSVGDEAFQRKCFAHLHAYKDRGGTVLFVSHAAATVLELCDRAMLLDRGDCLLVGTPKVAIESYHRLIFADPTDREEIRRQILAGETSSGPPAEVEPVGAAFDPSVLTESYDPELVPSSTIVYSPRGCTIEDPHLADLDGRRANLLACGQTYQYRYRVTFAQDCRQVRFGMLLKLLNGSELFGLASHPPGEGLTVVAAGRRVQVSFRFRAALLPGAYFLNAGVVGVDDEAETYLHRIIDAVMFRVVGSPRHCLTSHVDLSVPPFFACVEFAQVDGSA